MVANLPELLVPLSANWIRLLCIQVIDPSSHRFVLPVHPSPLRGLHVRPVDPYEQTWSKFCSFIVILELL